MLTAETLPANAGGPNNIFQLQLLSVSSTAPEPDHLLPVSIDTCLLELFILGVSQSHHSTGLAFLTLYSSTSDVNGSLSLAGIEYMSWL